MRGCWDGFIKYGTAVIWSGPRRYWPPREEMTVKRAGETTSWWMYYLCKGLIDEPDDSFMEEASARSNLINPPSRCHIRTAVPQRPAFGSELWVEDHRWSSNSRWSALPLWIEYECEAQALRKIHLSFSSRGDAVQQSSGGIFWRFVPWSANTFWEKIPCLYTRNTMYLNAVCCYSTDCKHDAALTRMATKLKCSLYFLISCITVLLF